MVQICAEVVFFLCITFSENILSKFLCRKNRIKFYSYGPAKIATAYLITDLARSNGVESTTQRWSKSAHPFLRTSQPEIFDARFRDYSQNSAKISATTYLS